MRVVEGEMREPLVVRDDARVARDERHQLGGVIVRIDRSQKMQWMHGVERDEEDRTQRRNGGEVRVAARNPPRRSKPTSAAAQPNKSHGIQMAA